MIDDELRQAARDLRRQVDGLVPPPIKARRQFGGRLLLVAASVAVFAAGGLLVASRLDDPSDPVDDIASDDLASDDLASDNAASGDLASDELSPDDAVSDDGALVDSFERTVASPLPDSLVGDTRHRPASPLSRPLLEVASTEAEFSTSITAITAAEADEAIVPVPGGAASWNADGSLLVLYEITDGWNGHALYDGRSFQRLRGLDVEPADVEELYWHPTDPDRLLYIAEGDVGIEGSTHALMAYSVDGATSTAIHRFAGCTDVDSTGVARPISDDGTRLGFMCRSDDGPELVAVDLRTGSEVRRPAAAGDIGPTPTPDGEGYVVVSGSGTLEVLDSELQPTGLSFAVGTDLFLLTGTDDGRQLYVTTVYGEPAETIGSVVAFDLSTGQSQVAVGRSSGFPYPPSGTRLATSAGGNGLVAIAILGQTEALQQDTLDGEILLVDFNRPEPTVGRLGHHRATATNPDIDRYFAAPSPAVDPTGRRVLFSSDWGEDRVDTFVVDLESATLGDGEGD